MKNICFEQGEITEIGETVSWGNSRYYTHLDLRDKEGKSIRLNAVAAALVVTPKIEVGNEVAIAFLRRNGIMTDTALGNIDTTKPVRHFKNVVFGVAVQDGYDVERKVPTGRVNAVLICMTIFALLAVLAVFTSIPLLAVVPGGISLFFYAKWSKYNESTTMLDYIEKKFGELGYAARMSRVYG